MKKKEIKWNVSKLEKLPTLSSVATQLIRLTMDERSDADQVAAIIETDQSLSSKILRPATVSPAASPRYQTR